MADAQQGVAGAKKLSAPRHHVVHGWIRAETHAAIERTAARERKHPDQIVADLVEKVYGPDGD